MKKIIVVSIMAVFLAGCATTSKQTAFEVGYAMGYVDGVEMMDEPVDATTTKADQKFTAERFKSDLQAAKNKVFH
jgi:uncharacterized protein YceK